MKARTKRKFDPSTPSAHGDPLLKISSLALEREFLGPVDLDYSLKSAGNSALSAPCTNRPVQCPRCSLVIPSYSMADHFEARHGSADNMDETLKQLVALKPHEQYHTEQLLRVKPGNVKLCDCSDIACTFPACMSRLRKRKQ